jgi:hypothetical protein
MTDKDFILEPVEQLIADLELYVTQLYGIKHKIENGKFGDPDLEADYNEVIEISRIWDNLGNV